MFAQPSDAILARLLTLHPKIIDLSLDRIERLLDRLDRPQDRLPPVVHLAGTNGKGSVAAFMRAALESAGYKVHAYTSPHLVRFHERIRLAGAPIDEPSLAAYLERCEEANGGAPITYFEITTAAAFLAFAENPADILLLECGLGGRLDATNLVERPLATVITPVSIDHQHFLGETLREIAGEKAAIQKPGVPSVIGPQPPEAAAAIDAVAARTGTPTFRFGRSFSVETVAGGLVYSARGRLTLPRPVLPGAHQIDNAAVAIAALERLKGFTVSELDMANGLLNASWPARIQRLRDGPLVGLLPDGWELWLDGGHNAAAGAALAAHAAAAWGDRPLWLVCGMMNNKQADRFLETLAPLAAGLRTVAIPGEENAFSAAELAEIATSAGLDAAPGDDLEAAVQSIAARQDGPARILICGSLYLAGKVLSENN
ncbi:MAG: bifunctional folylpolyglutamate synthase/dihydrofolate synthase [Alphaproteobacteria bacterium]|nr:bifunctional folylpolyglutamate synthase/dihydrofolate synthase [Alphaproteobacteria bacterium]